jgi:hypothetical protein
MAAAAGIGWFFVSKIRRVWRGESLRMLPMDTFRGPEINHRSYPVAASWMAIGTFGFALAGVGWLTGSDVVIFFAAVIIVLSMAVMWPLWISVNAWNRPQALVPPPHRHEPGIRQARKLRKQRRRSGKPDTEHPVEILEAHPLPTDPDQYEPYYVAVCSLDDCGWTSDVVDLGADPVAALAKVRRAAAKHSSVVTGPRRPLG